MTRVLATTRTSNGSGNPAAGLRVELLRDPSSMVAVQSEVEELCQDLCEPNVFFEPWFFLPALKHLAPRERLHLLCLYETGGRQRLCGFLPLIEGRLHSLLPLKTYEVWAHSQCFRCTPLVRKGYAGEFWTTVLSWLESRPWHRRLLDLQRLPAEGELWDCLQSALRERPSLRTLLYRFETAFLRCDQSYDEALGKAMSKSTRRKLLQQRRRLDKRGRLAFTDLEEGRPLDAVIEQFLKIEASGWKGRMGTALIAKQDEAGFFHDVIHAAYERKRLIFLSLRLDGRMIAAQCGFRTRSGAFEFKVAYDEAFARYSPGILLEMEEMRRMLDPGDPLRAGLSWVDSCAGPNDGPNYRCWPERRPVVRCRISTAWTPHAPAMAAWPFVRGMVHLFSGADTAHHVQRGTGEPRAR